MPASTSTLKRILYGFCILLVLFAIFKLIDVICLMGIRGPHSSADRNEATSNLRQIGLALFEFQAEYDNMPDFDTAAKVKKSKGSDLPMGKNSSNDFFRQLFAAEICENETIFYAKIPGTQHPDNQFSQNKTLEKGECGFTYFLGATMGCNSARPTVATPMIPGTDRFNPKPFVGKAIVLKADNSVMTLPIDKYGHVIWEGKNLMDPTHPVWEGRPPSIAWPDL